MPSFTFCPKIHVRPAKQGGGVPMGFCIHCHPGNTSLASARHDLAAARGTTGVVQGSRGARSVEGRPPCLRGGCCSRGLTFLAWDLPRWRGARHARAEQWRLHPASRHGLARCSLAPAALALAGGRRSFGHDGEEEGHLGARSAPHEVSAAAGRTAPRGPTRGTRAISSSPPLHGCSAALRKTPCAPS